MKKQKDIIDTAIDTAIDMNVIFPWPWLSESTATFGGLIFLMMRVFDVMFKVPISDKQIQTLEEVKGKLLWGTGNLFYIADFKTDQQLHRNIFGRKKIKTYLVSADMMMFNKKEGWWGRVILPPLRFIANMNDLQERRQQYLDMVRSIEKAGISITPYFRPNDYY